MAVNESLAWRECLFEQLSTHELYQLMQLRVDVFVVEQQCHYSELDGQDLLNDTVHLFATSNQVPVAYARVLAPLKPADKVNSSLVPAVHIGRVVVAAAYRGRGIASQLMQRVLQCCKENYPQHDQALAAQVEVTQFYASLGFCECGEPYLDEGIAHIDMRRLALSS